jgi:hypothetical protein
VAEWLKAAVYFRTSPFNIKYLLDLSREPLCRNLCLVPALSRAAAPPA